MAYEGPIWYVDTVTGFDGEDNGGDVSPIETVAYAISRIGIVGFGSTAHTIRIKANGLSSYGTIDATTLSPTLTNKFILTVWDVESNGIPLVDKVSIVSNMVVEGFRFSGAVGSMIDVGIGLATIANVTIRTNVFNMVGDPYWILIGSSNLLDIDNLNIIQNTFVDRVPQSNYGINFQWESVPNGITNSNISNNIFYRFNYGVLSDLDITGMANSDLVITNNCFYDSAIADTLNTPSPVNSVITDPLFTNYSSGDYSLQNTSPCLDAGTNIETTNVDIDGSLRPIYQTWDIGAYEIQSTFLSQIVGGNSFDKGSGVTKTSVVSATHILALPIVFSDSNFNNESFWARVITVYKHSDGQRKVVSHLLISGTWQGQVVFSGNANVGDWEKREIILIDNDGDGLAIDRDKVTDVEDIVIS